MSGPLAKTGGRLLGECRQGSQDMKRQNDVMHICLAMRKMQPSAGKIPLEHDPEKWRPVFGEDHAQTKNISVEPDSTQLKQTIEPRF
ncbi:hypothetical protein [Nitrobacter winogradskyi]|uniref:hypothetical protein n=1 Tax=Nitrobacter winogradskyi TaxID=913 RepID=UPI001AEF1325|nr:hypothetical protein [Nitrobacter winogradskyi]